jgi:hypothetical protein
MLCAGEWLSNSHVSWHRNTKYIEYDRSGPRDQEVLRGFTPHHQDLGFIVLMACQELPLGAGVD